MMRWNAPRRGAGGDDDFFRFQRLSIAFGNLNPPFAGQARRAFDPVDLVLLEQELDSSRQAVDDAVLARVDLVHVDGRRRGGNGDSPFLRIADHLQRMRVLEKRFGGNTSPDQAGAAERFLLFDDRDFLSELCASDRRHISAGAGANDHNIVRSRHEGLTLSKEIRRCQGAALYSRR